MRALALPNPLRVALCLVCLGASRPAPAETAAGLAVSVAAISAPPTIDGLLSEAVWAHSANVPAFRQWSPDLGEAGSFPTEEHVLADDHYLYVGARLEQDPTRGPLVVLVHRRDVFEQTDLFRVWFDPKGDGRQALVFGVNAANVQQDAAWSRAHAGRACSIEDESEQWALLALQGPRALATWSALATTQQV